MKWTYVSHVKATSEIPKVEDSNKIIVLKLMPATWWEKNILRVKSQDFQFIGHSTIWYWYPEYDSCGVLLNGILANYEKWIDHGKPDKPAEIRIAI